MNRGVMIRRGAWVLGGVAVLLWRCGYGSFPDSPLLAHEVVPALPSLPRLPPGAQFILGSPIGAIVASLFRATTETSFDLVHVGVFLGFIIVLGAILLRREGPVSAALVGAGFVGSQTSVVLLAWIGSYDVFTVGFSSMLVILRRWWALAIVGFLLSFSAFEQGLIVIAMLIVLALFGLVGRWRGFTAALVGLLVGRVVLQFWLHANDVTHDRLWFIRTTGLDVLLDQFWRSLPWLVPTALGATAVAVIVSLGSEPRWRERIVVITLLVLCLVPVAVSLDQSRVYAVLSWPIVMVVLMRYARRTEASDVERLSVLTLGLAALFPGIFVWEGRAQLAHHHLIRVLLRR